MEYQVTVISTYWVEANDRDEARRIVRQGRIRPENVEIEVNA
jgi:hypothetical protein